MRTLIVLQSLGIVAATIAAGIKIQSILFSGPALTLLGLALAAAAFLKNRPCGLYFALGAPTVAVVSFALIYGFNWLPEDAHLPIARLIFVSAVFLVMLSCLAVR